MLVGEGDVYSFSGNYDVAGIVGNVSAIVDWGDGTTSPVASINGGNQTGNLRIRFDYSLDTRRFFSGSNSYRRNVLQIAADSLIKRFGDDLSAITPGGIKEWIPYVNHPSSGPSNQLLGTRTALARNLRVNANEIIIYPGSRNLPYNQRGVGGQASYEFPATQFSCRTQAECNQKLAQIEAFRDVVRGRGESGALRSTQTDVAPQVGSVSFDSDTKWYFGLDPDAIKSDEVDFISVATHEIAHVLGFGVARSGETTSWERLTSSGKLAGSKSKAAYQGSGAPPVSASHWANSVLSSAGQSTVMAGQIPIGKRTPLSPLDLAAMDDLGWDLLNTRASVTANHRYADDGQYDVRLILQGSKAGKVPRDVATISVSNVRPTLSVAANRSATVGQPFSITDIATLTDPGFVNNSSTPPTTETFSYTINWGDGTAVESGTATIDQTGNSSGGLTRASFNGSHTYQSTGNKTVTVRVTDDDGATASKTFRITVAAPPALALSLNRPSIDENSGTNAATLRIDRSGPATGSNQTIQLTSSDTTEARLPTSVVIPANSTFVTVPVQAIDDALLDGDITVNLSASGQGVETDTIDLIVKDIELLTASFSKADVREGQTVNLIVQRSNTDVALPLAVSVSGGIASELGLPSQITVPTGQRSVVIPVLAIDDSDFEPSQTLQYTFVAAGYLGASAEIVLTDDEPTLFQNATSRFDVSNDGNVTASDALRVINELASRGGPAVLDPTREQPEGIFLDVNGDYRVSAADALAIINQLSKNTGAGTASGEEVHRAEIVPIAYDITTLDRQAGDETLRTADDDRLRRLLDAQI